MDNTQKIQDNQYTLPYHHIPRYGNGKFSQTREVRFGYEYISYINEIIKTVSNYKDKSLLDVGCGDGKLIFELKKIFEPKNIEGIDYSKDAINFAKVFSPEVNFYTGDITKEGILSKKYDIITLIETLEHIPPEKIPEFLKAIKKYIQKDGVFLITVPSTNIATQPKHYQHFDQTKLQETLHPHFLIEKVYFLNKKGFLNRIIKTILSNRIFILNQYKTLNFIYKYYCKHLLHAKEKNCRRLLLICKPNLN